MSALGAGVGQAQAFLLLHHESLNAWKHAGQAKMKVEIISSYSWFVLPPSLLILCKFPWGSRSYSPQKTGSEEHLLHSQLPHSVHMRQDIITLPSFWPSVMWTENQMGVLVAKMVTPIIYRFGLKITWTAFCEVPSSQNRLEIDIVVESLRII